MFINQIGFLILGLMIRDYAFSTPCGRGNREQDIKTRKNSPSKIGYGVHTNDLITANPAKVGCVMPEAHAPSAIFGALGLTSITHPCILREVVDRHTVEQNR
jgi:hypothetical protein